MAEKTPHEMVMEAFNSLKEANEANEKKRDVLLEEQLGRINTRLDAFEDINKAVTAASAVAKEQQAQLDRLEMALNRNGLPGAGATDKDAVEFRNAFDHFLRHAPEDRDREAMATLQRMNTLVKSSDTGAGYLLAPAEVQRDILKDIIEQSPFRTLATVRQIGGEALKQPKRTAAAGAARRVGEIEPRVNTGDPAYGILTWNAPEMFARGEISQQMLEDSDYDLIAELRSEFSEQFAVREGREFLIGSGSNNEAEGLLVAEGVGTVNSGDAAKITADGLIILTYTLKSAYARNASFILQRMSLAAIRLLKTTDNQYLWQPGLTGTTPNTILGHTYTDMPDMPAIEAGSTPVAFGDWKKAYVVVDRIGLGFQTDFITGADNGIVIFRGRKRVGGGVKQTEAFKKLVIGA